MLEFLQKALPWIGAAATGNVPALVGMAAKAVGDAIGQDIAPQAEAIANAVAGATPEQIAAMKTADNDFRLKMQALGFEHIEEMEKLGIEKTKVFVEDTQDARGKFAQSEAVFKLGVCIVLSFGIVVGLSLWGSYLLLSGGITIKDVGIVAAVFGFLGTVVGYMAANAQQVVGFFYGSSSGSKEKTDRMAESVQQLGAALGKR